MVIAKSYIGPLGQSVNEPAAPIAEAGADQVALNGDEVTLDGLSSYDPNNDPLSYSWEQLSGPAVTFNDSTLPNPSFIAPADASLSFQLTVTANGESDSDTVIIITEKPPPPIADASVDQTVVNGALVTLDGSSSYDPNSAPLIYFWEQLSGLPVTFSNSTLPNPTFTAPFDASLSFQLTVTVNEESTSDVVNIISKPAPPPSESYPWQWVEGEGTQDGATRDYYNRGELLEWQQYLGDWVDRDNTPYGSIAFATAPIVDNDSTQTISFDLTSLANEWASQPRLNNGILLKRDRGSFNFRSREYDVPAERPVLEIIVNGQTILLPAQADTFLAASTYQSQGTLDHLKLHDDNTPLLRFNLSAFPGMPISQATLKLVSYAQYERGEAILSVFAVPLDKPEPTLTFTSWFTLHERNYSHNLLICSSLNLRAGPNKLDMGNVAQNRGAIIKTSSAIL